MNKRSHGYEPLYAPLDYASQMAAVSATSGPDTFKLGAELRTPIMRDTPLTMQEGGSHYKDMKIQPVQYIHANGIGYFEGNVIKYVSRWRAKGGKADLEKAKHYIELLLQLEGDTK